MNGVCTKQFVDHDTGILRASPFTRALNSSLVKGLTHQTRYTDDNIITFVACTFSGTASFLTETVEPDLDLSEVLLDIDLTETLLELFGVVAEASLLCA